MYYYLCIFCRYFLFIPELLIKKCIEIMFHKSIFFFLLQISHWRFPECSLRDKFLHFFFIVNVCLMIACAAVTIICFKEIENVCIILDLFFLTKFQNFFRRFYVQPLINIFFTIISIDYYLSSNQFHTRLLQIIVLVN